MKRITLQEMAVLAVLGVLLGLGKWALAALPNIEIVSLLIMVYTYKFGLRALIPVYIFVGIEMVQFGPNLWNIMYLYIWALLVFAVLPLRKVRKGWVFALVGGLYGACFGLLCAISYIFTLGWEFALSWLVGGLLYDGLHAAGNFAAALMLYMPLTKALDKIRI